MGTSYAPNEWVFNPFAGYGNSSHVGITKQAPQASIPRTIPDGTSNTILFAEKFMACGLAPNSVANFYFGETGGINSGRCNRLGAYGVDGSTPAFYTVGLPQFAPLWNATCNPCQLQGMFLSGILVGLADGSARNVNSSISAATWQAAVRPDDAVPLGSDW
jgi:hypothetical protein